MQQTRFLKIADGRDYFLVNVENILYIEDNGARFAEIHFKQKVNDKDSIVVEKPFNMVEDLIKELVIKLV